MSHPTAVSKNPQHLAWISTENDPARYSAIEEACLRESTDSFVILWINQPALFVGKNQNLWAEVSAKEALRTGVSLNRRLSGGGTVYHDPGNLNFSFISNGKPQIAFEKHLNRLLPYFQSHGIDAGIRNRSDLFFQDRKFSGNAEYFSGGRVLHHGTLLFSTDLAQLARLLTPHSNHYTDKAIDSNRSQTLNLQSVLPHLPSTTAFARDLLDFLLANESDLREVDHLPGELLKSSERYLPQFKDPDWIFGRSPQCEFEREVNSGTGLLRSQLQIARGRIKRVSLWGDGIDLSHQVQSLVGCLHTPVEVQETLGSAAIVSPGIAPLLPLFLDLFF